MDESCECNAEIVADVEGCLVKPNQEEKIESHHAESSVLHNLYSGTGGKPGGEERSEVIKSKSRLTEISVG